MLSKKYNLLVLTEMAGGYGSEVRLAELATANQEPVTVWSSWISGIIGNPVAIMVKVRVAGMNASVGCLPGNLMSEKEAEERF